MRGVSGEYYALSNEVWEWSVCRCGVLSAVDGIDWILLRLRRSRPPVVSTESGRQVRLRYFSGRSRPVAEISAFTDRVHTLEYSFRPEERGELERLMALEGRTVIYKNQHGVRLIGVLSGLSGQQDWAADLRLTITAYRSLTLNGYSFSVPHQ